MLDLYLFGNHIVGFPTRRLKCFYNFRCRFSNILAPVFKETADKIKELFPVSRFLTGCGKTCS